MSAVNDDDTVITTETKKSLSWRKFPENIS